MTVAYLILAYHLPEQAARLARLIVRSSPRARVFLHYDAKSGPFDDQLLAGAERITVIPDPLTVEWGDWSPVAALLHCLTHIRNVMEFDWFTVLSGQDFPIRPIARFEECLATGAADVYIEAYPLSANPTTRASHVVARYYYRYWKLPRFRYSHRVPHWIRTAWQGWLCRRPEGRGFFNYIWLPRGLPPLLGVRRLRVPFTPEFECWQGSDWFNLSRHAVDYLFEFLARHPEVSRHYQHTHLPSESLYHTIYCNARDLRVERNNLRFILWDSPDTSSPRTLTCENLDAMREAPAFFARKFDMRVDPAVLDRLEAAAELG